MVVGNSLSGQDISLELVSVAKEVHLSAKSLQISEGLTKVIYKYQNLHIQLQVLYMHVNIQKMTLFYQIYQAILRKLDVK